MEGPQSDDVRASCLLSWGWQPREPAGQKNVLWGHTRARVASTGWHSPGWPPGLGHLRLHHPPRYWGSLEWRRAQSSIPVPIQASDSDSEEHMAAGSALGGSAEPNARLHPHQKDSEAPGLSGGKA